jgi:serine protease inhibitor
MSKTILSIIITPLLLLASCDDGTSSGSNDGTSKESDAGPSEETLELYLLSDENAAKVGGALVEANTDFAVRMFKSLVEEHPGENVIYSPVSVSVALAMTMNGAVDETFDGMQEALSFTGMTMEDINQQLQSLLLSLEHADEDVVLSLANSIWLNPGYPVKQSFVDTVESWYSSDVFEADTPDTLNAWIEEKTGGHITKMITEFPVDLVMYLVNAIYFKGAWTTTFDKEDTYKTTFIRSDDNTVNVDMMAFTDRKEYDAYSNETVIGIRLSYGRGKIAFYAFVPLEWSQGTIDDFLSTLDSGTLDMALDAFKPMELGGVRLPKFKIEFEEELDDILKAFGMEAAYEGGFDNITDPADGRPLISMVKHKAYIEVTEEGTEAAAATVVEMVDEAAPMMFMANRPFVFLIRDDRNGTILFMGKVEDPTAG